MPTGVAQNWRHERAADSTYTSIHLTIEDRDTFLHGNMTEAPWFVPDGEPFDVDLTAGEQQELCRIRERAPLNYHQRHWNYGSTRPRSA
jgi:hypothetical protein